MDFDKLNKWLSLFANVGVLAGIIFLAVEIGQNTETIRLTEIQANRLNSANNFREASESDHIPPILMKKRAGEELTPEETYRYGQYIGYRWANAYYNWIQRDLDIAGGYLPSLEVAMPGLINTPDSLDFWQRFGVRIYPEGFVEFTEDWIDRVSNR